MYYTCLCPYVTFDSRIHAKPDYSGATWKPANKDNYDVANRPHDYPIEGIVIHTMQGTLDGSTDWFQNPQAQVSAHYLIGSDGRIEQMVPEKDIAFQAGSRKYNRGTIGIEHEGYVDQPKWYTPELFEASAKVAGYLAKKYGIPIVHRKPMDSNIKGFYGHEEIPGQEHRRFDPGNYWNWDKYMALVKKYSK